jgi:hypothetical protein
LIHVAKTESEHAVETYCGYTIELQPNGDTAPPHDHDFVLYPDGPTEATCRLCLARDLSEFARRWVKP